MDGEEHHFIHILLCDLYHILFIAACRQTAPLHHSTYEYVTSRHKELLSHVLDQEPANTLHPAHESSTTSNDTNDQRIAPLRLSVLILTSWILSSSEKQDKDQAQNLTGLTARLRALLDSSNSGLHHQIKWLPFPGALMWCHAIGLRFGDQRYDRMWFLMQFLRVSHLGVLETWEETSRSLEMIVRSLERTGREHQRGREREMTLN